MEQHQYHNSEKSQYNDGQKNEQEHPSMRLNINHHKEQNRNHCTDQNINHQTPQSTIIQMDEHSNHHKQHNNNPHIQQNNQQQNQPIQQDQYNYNQQQTHPQQEQLEKWRPADGQGHGHHQPSHPQLLLFDWTYQDASLQEPLLPPLVSLTVDRDFLAPALMSSVMRFNILKTAMFLRQSNAKLQDELRDTMKAYGQEKQHLQAQLANLRLDLGELIRDDQTITTDSGASHHSFSNGSEPELKRLEELQGDTARSLHLPSIKNLHLNPDDKCDQDSDRRKNLRFLTRNNTQIDGVKQGTNKSFLGESGWDRDTKEQQKFQELQKNQDVLRNIGRANLREKRMSLIRLPTINSAKKRTTLWDSGKNVSRPKGQSTAFETFPYVQDSIALSQRNFKIPQIKDPQRSEIQLSDLKKLDNNKKKVQFLRPQDDSMLTVPNNVNPHDPSVMGGESLNTTLADTSLGDTTMGNISFDEEQYKALAQRSLGNNATTTTVKQEQDNTPNSNNVPATANAGPNTVEAGPAVDKPKNLVVPPLQLKRLAKKNVMLHDMNNMRISPSQPLPKITKASDKSSDKSIGTNISRLSLETEKWKSLYQNIPDPDVRNKTLSDIMFAVRSRMKDNEATLRFGETPRPSDNTYCDYLLYKTTPRWNNGSPRKAKQVINKGRKGQPSPSKSFQRVDKGKDKARHLQSYLKKMYRQRKTIDRVAGEQYKLAHFGGHKQLQLVAQEA